MTYYVVIDTNVIVSAMMSIRDDSATVLLLERFFDGDFVPVYSSEIMNEYREVLGRKKFSFSPQKINIVLSEFERSGILVEPSALGIVLPDMKDLPFYEVIMEKKDDNAYLVTGNLKHFPNESFIVTARQMLDILDNDN